MGIKKWILPRQDPDLTLQLSEQTALSPLLCAILYGRGYETSEEIMAMVGDELLLDDPCTLIDMDRAVARVQQALESGETIAIYGDYDCDGITSTALMVSYLQSVGANLFYYIPSREKEGYGMNMAAVDLLHQQGATLVITVDNGISAHEEIAYAATLGIDVVVTDHHTPRETLPPAVAVVNPHRADCPSRFKELAGVGVAFKLICALEGEGGEELLEYYSDIVMLGTVADVVSLTGENRTIVRHGLARIQECERPGINALVEVSGLNGAVISSESAAFALIPRLNAAGRMDCVDDAVELLLTDDVAYARELAQSIDAHNEERKKIETVMLQEIDDILESNPEILTRRILVLSGHGWHHGVVGIVAAKVLERYGKPTILFSVDDSTARGSGRSIEGFSLIEAISNCCGKLTQYGGHTLAAGLSLAVNDLSAFVEELQLYAAEHFPVMPVATCEVDCILTPRYMTTDALRALSRLEPFGQGNRSPLFLLQNLQVEGVFPTADKKHIRIRLSSGGESFYAVYFRVSEDRFPYGAGDRVDVVAGVGVQLYNGKEQISVKVRDLRMANVPQEGVLQGMEWYARYRCGELVCPTEELLPQRADFAAVYRYLRARNGFRYDDVELYFRLLPTGVSYTRLLVVLDVLEELGLIARGGDGPTIRLLPAQQKVELETSKILSCLRV